MNKFKVDSPKMQIFSEGGNFRVKTEQEIFNCIADKLFISAFFGRAAIFCTKCALTIKMHKSNFLKHSFYRGNSSIKLQAVCVHFSTI